MMSKNILRGILISTTLATFTLLFSTCGGARQPTLQSGAHDVLVGGKDTPETGVIQGENGKSVALADVLKELEELEPPPGVDASLFAQIKDALSSELSTLNAQRSPAEAGSTGRFVSKPPTGPANRVDDLTLLDNLDGTFTLTWTYKNVGDYDQNGIVAIADITPLAEHFQETAEGEGDSWRGWIDGNADGIINIQDITPIAENFFSQVWEYVIEGASLTTPGDFSEFARVSFVTTNKEQRGTASLTFSADDAGLLTTFRVVPVDYENNRGEVSNEVSLPVSAPIIYSVTPTQGFKNEAYTFTANVSGTRPLSYQWDFGGGANPSLFPSPPGGADVVTAEVTLADTPGDYSALLTVTNQYGEDTYSFTLTVQAREVWVHTWGGSGSESARDLVFDDEGNIYILGRTNSPEFTAGANKEDDLLLLKYSPHGEVLWARTWGGEKSEKAVGIHLAPDGNLVVAGQTNSFGAGRDDVLLLKYNLDGNLIFQKTWGTADLYERVNGSCIDELGNIYIVGYTIAYGSSSTDLLIARFDSEGNLLWGETWDFNGGDQGVGVLALSNVALYVVGSVGSSLIDAESALMLELRPDGQLARELVWDTLDWSDYSSSLLPLSGGTFLITGSSVNRQTNEWRAYFLEINSNLEVQTATASAQLGSVIIGGDGRYYYRGSTKRDGISYPLVGVSVQLGASASAYLWNAEWSSFGLAFDSLNNIYYSGTALNAIGSWEDFPSIEFSEIGGTLSSISGELQDIQGDEILCEGKESYPEGVLDIGAGGVDVLIMKGLAWLW